VKRIPTCGRHRAGQATVEFAIVATAFFLLMFAVIQMGMAIYAYNTLWSATQEGARYAVMHGPNRTPTAQASDVKNVMLNTGAMLQSGNLTVTLSWPTDANLSSQKDALVNSTYNYQFQIPFLTTFTLPLKSNAQMLAEQ